MLAMGYFVYYVTAHAPELTRTAGLEPREIVIGEPIAVFEVRGLPRYNETVTAAPARPLNVLIVAPDDLVLDSALEAAGWRPARRTGLRTLYRLLDAASSREEDDDDDDDEDFTPAAAPFWNGRYVDFAFADTAAAEDAPRFRPAPLMLRLWKTRFRTADGRAVYVGVASEAEPAWRFAYSGRPVLDSARDALVRRPLLQGAHQRAPVSSPSSRPPTCPQPHRAILPTGSWQSSSSGRRWGLRCLPQKAQNAPNRPLRLFIDTYRRRYIIH